MKNEIVPIDIKISFEEYFKNVRYQWLMLNK